MFTVALMFKQMQTRPRGIIPSVYLARMEMIQGGFACSNVCYNKHLPIYRYTFIPYHGNMLSNACEGLSCSTTRDVNEDIQILVRCLTAKTN